MVFNFSKGFFSAVFILTQYKALEITISSVDKSHNYFCS